MYLLIIIFKKSEFMAAQRARPILLNERFLVIIYIISRARVFRVYVRTYVYIRAHAHVILFDAL